MRKLRILLLLLCAALLLPAAAPADSLATRYTPSARTSAAYVAAVVSSSANTVPYEGRTSNGSTFSPSARSVRAERSSATFSEMIRPTLKSPVPLLYRFVPDRRSWKQATPFVSTAGMRFNRGVPFS